MGSNYVVLDDLPVSKRPSATSANNKKKYNSSQYIIIGVAILVVMIIIIIVASRVQVRDNYSSLEIEMVKKAEEYVKDYHIEDKELYLDATKLDIKIPNNCNKMSGVIYQTGEYTPYLVCDNYESNYLDVDGKVNLVGRKIILLTRGSKYYELGYHGDEEIQISGKVNTDKEGIYNVYYIPKTGKDYTIRKVIVVDNSDVLNLLPKVNIDDKEITIEIGQDYQENIMAIDSNDGNITNKMIKLENINNNEIGEYKNYYSITNSLGYTTMAMKKIIVVGSLDGSETSVITTLSNDNMTNENVIISVKIISNLYDHAILPDNTTTNNKEFDFEVSESGNYEFVIYNRDNTQVTKIVTVDNIDKTIPSGSCRATLHNDNTVFSTNITSFNYIVGYDYIVDGKESGYVTNNSYTFNVGATTGEVFVKVKDYINNEAVIKCETIDNKYKYDPNGYRDLKTHTSRLHIPITEALSKRGHTVNDLNMCIKKRVIEAGPGTRYGVVEAAVGLIECTYDLTGYVLPYNHSGGKVEEENTKSGGKTNYCGGINKDICGKLGINTNWGKEGGSCNSSQCWYGLNCATFVRWSMCNGGMDLCSKGGAGAYSMANVKYFPEADIVNVWGNKTKSLAGRDLTNYTAEQLVRMIKPGDVVAQFNTKTDVNGSTHHTYVVIGKDENNIYTANDGYFYRTYSYKQLLNGELSLQILFLDNYYANPQNRNNLYD